MSACTCATARFEDDPCPVHGNEPQSWDELAQELADADYVSQIGEISDALRSAYEQGASNMLDAATSFSGQDPRDILREFELHFRRRA